MVKETEHEVKNLVKNAKATSNTAIYLVDCTAGALLDQAYPSQRFVQADGFKRLVHDTKALDETVIEL